MADRKYINFRTWSTWGWFMFSNFTTDGQLFKRVILKWHNSLVRLSFKCMSFLYCVVYSILIFCTGMSFLYCTVYSILIFCTGNLLPTDPPASEKYFKVVERNCDHPAWTHSKVCPLKMQSLKLLFKKIVFPWGLTFNFEDSLPLNLALQTWGFILVEKLKTFWVVPVFFNGIVSRAFWSLSYREGASSKKIKKLQHFD